MLPVFIGLGLLSATAMAQDQPPANDTAVEPYWPHYPTDKSEDDYKMWDNASPDDLAGTSQMAQWIITASNVFRSQPVTWNQSCANEANVHVNTCRWEHWGSDNLASLSSSDDTARFDLNPMIQMWAQEWDYYPFRHPEAEAYSHFTAMVWNDSTTVGCSWNVNCPEDDNFPSRTYFVCNYWPPGNLGTNPPGQEYAKNVGNFTKWTNPDQVPDPPLSASEGDHGGAPSVNVTINGTQVETVSAQSTRAAGAATASPQTSNVSPNHTSDARELCASLAMVVLGLGVAIASM